MRMRRSLSTAVPFAILFAATQMGCGSGDGEASGTAEQSAIGFCNGSDEGVRGLVCNVGVTPDGELAVLFKGQWFSLAESNSAWTIQNNVVATAALDAVPYDAPRIVEKDSSCRCESRSDCIERCGSARPPSTIIDRRTFRVRAGASDYTVEAREVIYDERVQTSCTDVLQMKRDMVFEVHRVEPGGGEWTVLVTPRRIANLGTPQNVLNESATEPGSTGQTSAADSLFAAGNVTYEPNVELSSAVRTGAVGLAEDAVPANAATQAAFDTVMLQDPSFQRVLQGDDANPALPILRSDGARLASNWGGGSLAVDLQRYTDVWLDNRRGSSGWSEKGQDRPNATSGGKNIVLRRGAEIQRTIHFPFLAGICGFEASFNAFVRSEFRSGTRKCFDGAPVTEASGFFEAGAGLGAGFGCNILVASASAGVEGVATALARFDSAVTTAPPSLRSTVTLKARVRLNAYFKSRVLFWSRKWTGTIAEKELFNRAYTYSLEPLGSDRRFDLCDGVPRTDGTCSDPNSTCDVNDRCIRYDLTPGAGPEPGVLRVDTGACSAPVEAPAMTCPARTNDARQEGEQLVQRFAAGQALCASNPGACNESLFQPLPFAPATSPERCAPSAVCSTLRRVSDHANLIAFWGTSAEGGLPGGHVGGGIDFVFDLERKQAASFLYGSVAGNPFSVVEGMVYRGYAATSTPNVIQAWQGYFLGTTASVGFGKLLSVTAGGFSSPDGGTFGALGGITGGLPSVPSPATWTPLQAGFWVPFDAGTRTLASGSYALVTDSALNMPGGVSNQYQYVQFNTIGSLLLALQRYPMSSTPSAIAIGRHVMKQYGLTLDQLCPR